MQPIPDVTVQGSVSRNFATEDVVGGLQIGVPLPVWNRNEGNVSAAQAAIDAAAADLRRLELSLRNRLAEAYRDYEQAVSQSEQYRDEVLPEAKRSLELTTRGYEAGEVDFLRVLTARRVYVANYTADLDAATCQRTARALLDGVLLSGGLEDPGTTVNAGGGGGGTRPLTATPKTE